MDEQRKSAHAKAIADASEALYLAIVGAIEEGVAPLEVVKMQQAAPSIREERNRQKRQQARQIAAHQVTGMGGFGRGPLMSGVQLAGMEEYLDEV